MGRLWGPGTGVWVAIYKRHSVVCKTYDAYTVQFNRLKLARLILIMAMNRFLGTALCISSFTLILVEVWSTQITGVAVVKCSPGQQAFGSPVPGRVISRRTDRRINTRSGES